MYREDGQVAVKTEIIRTNCTVLLPKDTTTNVVNYIVGRLKAQMAGNCANTDGSGVACGGSKKDKMSAQQAENEKKQQVIRAKQEEERRAKDKEERQKAEEERKQRDEMAVKQREQDFKALLSKIEEMMTKNNQQLMQKVQGVIAKRSKG